MARVIKSSDPARRRIEYAPGDVEAMTAGTKPGEPKINMGYRGRERWLAEDMERPDPAPVFYRFPEVPWEGYPTPLSKLPGSTLIHTIWSTTVADEATGFDTEGACNAAIKRWNLRSATPTCHVFEDALPSTVEDYKVGVGRKWAQAQAVAVTNGLYASSDRMLSLQRFIKTRISEGYSADDLIAQAGDAAEEFIRRLEDVDQAHRKFVEIFRPRSY